MPSKKVIVIGLDGATFKLIKPWIKEGNLPTFKEMMENGVYGDLESTIPPTTCPAIPSFYTGKDPEKILVFGFTKKDHVITSIDIKSDKIWDILTRYGIKSLIMNVPVTYPPSKIKGHMITGFLTPSKDSDFTYPKKLKLEISDYPIATEYPTDDVIFDLEKEEEKNKKYIFEKQIEVTRKRFQIFKRLLKKYNYDFSLFFVKGTDIIQHLFWGENNKILQYYKLIDKEISEFVEKNINYLYFLIMVFTGWGK